MKVLIEDTVVDTTDGFGRVGPMEAELVQDHNARLSVILTGERFRVVLPFDELDCAMVAFRYRAELLNETKRREKA